MKKIKIAVALISLPILSFAQDKGYFSGGFESNSQYYTDDSKLGDFPEDNRFRSNNYLKLTYDYKNWFANAQVESYEPQALLNYYPKHKGTNLGTYAIGYRSSKFETTLGYFYEQFGSGLALRSWEDRQLGINNAIRGARILYRPIDALELTGLYGRQRDGFDVSDGDIFAFNAEIGLDQIFNFETSSLNLGLSYVGRDESVEVLNPEFKPLTHMISSRIDYAEGNFYSSLEYVSKSNDLLVELGNIKEDGYTDGSAVLLNMGYAQPGLGIDATFRRMENMTFHSQRDISSNFFNQNMMNYLPALTKQHDYSLTNIYVYQAQPALTYNPIPKAGEMGGQIDVYYTIAKETALGGKYGTKLAFNFSSWSGLKGDFDIATRSFESDGFFSFGENYYRDFSLEINKKLSESWSSIFTIVSTYYNKRYIEDSIGEVNATVLAAEGTYQFGTNKSIRIEGQHLFTGDDKKNWVAGTLEFNLNSNFSFFATDMYNYGNDFEPDRVHYYNVGGSYTKGASRVGVSYGRQRGGLVCVGGICRFVPQNTGFTLNLSTSF